MQEKTWIIIFFVRKKRRMNQPNAFLGVRPQDVAPMKVDHTKGAIILKHAINNSEHEHGFPQQKVKNTSLWKRNIIFRNPQIIYILWPRNLWSQRTSWNHVRPEGSKRKSPKRRVKKVRQMSRLRLRKGQQVESLIESSEESQILQVR